MSGVLLARGAPHPQVSSWLKATDPDWLWASFSFGQVRKGIERLAAGKRRIYLEEWLERDLEEWFEERLLRVTKGIADRWGAIPAQALDRGKPLPSIDGVIAATPLGVTQLNPWEA